MELKEHRYEIGGKAYTQRRLVFGQIRQLSEVISGMTLPSSKNAVEWAMALVGAPLRDALAIVLIPEGQEPRTKDNAAIAADVDWEMLPEQVLEVIEDFFACNPISSLTEPLERMMAKMGAAKESLVDTSPGLPGGTPLEAGT